MMKKGIAKRSSLFLLEIIIAILFFALASTVCIQLFVKSHTLVMQTKDLDMAVNKVQNMAESIRGTDGSFEALLDLYPTAGLEDSALIIYYNKDYESLLDGRRDAAYRLKAERVADGQFSVYSVDMTGLDSEEMIYSLEIKIYNDGQGKGAPGNET